MDVVSLILVFLFFILPIIQQVLERSRQRGPAEGVPDEETDGEVGEWEAAKESREPLATEPVAASKGPASERWSESWGSWPSAPPEPGTARVEEPELRDDVEVKRSEHPARRPPLERMLAPEVDRLESQRAIGMRGHPIPEGGPISQGARELEVRLRRSRGAMLPLNDPADLRRAILLSEVLGSPVSLRESDERR